MDRTSHRVARPVSRRPLSPCTRLWRFGRPGRQSEGGEALLLTASEHHQVAHPAPGGRTEPLSAALWFVLWTRSHCERLVHDQLSNKGLASFLPEREIWSRRGVLRHVIRVPMFPGYLFLHTVLDKATHIEVRKTRGLVSLLGSTAEGPAAVPETEVTALQKLVKRSEEHTSELQSPDHLVCRLLLEKKKANKQSGAATDRVRG